MSAGQLTIVVHGGAGGDVKNTDGCNEAASSGFGQLQAGAGALPAALRAVVMMEDDGRFNAGTGAALGLDGETIEMDASVMDTRGILGAVACVRDVKNPVMLARTIADSPSWLMCAEGAQRFAELEGLARHPGATDNARRMHADLIARLNSENNAIPGVPNEIFARLWNYPEKRKFLRSGPFDTVGAVARDHEGHFAVAASTGGSAPSLLGRVGDTPILGAGFYAGEHGAVAATGIGEEIVRAMLAITVYRWLEDGMPLQQALDRGIALFDPELPIGLIAVTHTEAGSASNTSMPVAVLRAPVAPA